MVISLNELKKRPFAVDGVSALWQQPLYRTIDHRKNGRQCSGLILVSSGECRFDCGNESFTACAHDAVYLPLGSRHTLTLTGESPSFYRVDFLLYGKDFTPLFLSNRPFLLARSLPEECRSQIRTLAENTQKQLDSLFVTESVAFILRTCADGAKSEGAKRLEKAVCALHDNFSEVPSVRHLAALSHLSTSRFYELFCKEFGCTPLAYRDALLFARAKTLLRGGDLTVGETAAALGFADPAYFSRFFKRKAGVSPAAFAEGRD